LGVTSSALTSVIFSGLGHFSPGVPVLESDGSLVARNPRGALYEGASESMDGIATDFGYSACIALPATDTSGDLQFRISNEGRYGVAFEATPGATATTRIRFYRLKRKVTLATVNTVADSYDYISLTSDIKDLPTVPFAGTHCLTVVATGTTFVVSVDGVSQLTVNDVDRPMLSGRFGLYTLSPVQNRKTRFTTVSATTDPTATSNFATLYSTLGYELNGTKRAFVRSITTDATFPDDNGLVDLNTSTFELLDQRGLSQRGAHPLAYGAMFGMRLWEANFSNFQAAGTYRVRFNLHGPGLSQVLYTDYFTISDHLLTNTILRGMSIQNADARNGAEEDLRNNWEIKSGSWSVDRDGAFIATNADTGAGAVVERTWNGYLEREDEDPEATYTDFTLTGSVAIMGGCDAALLFYVTPTSRYAVTLVAGANGRCPQNSSSGSVRLSREVGSGYQPLVEVAYPVVGATSHDVLVRVSNGTVTVKVNEMPLISHSIGTGRGKFGLGTWGGTARFDKVRVWKPETQFTWLGATGWPPERVAVTSTNATCEQAAYHAGKDDTPAVKPVCYPESSQRHGYHDCNNYIAEATSHGSFLAGLVDVWAKRRSTLTQTETTKLRDAILRTDSYLGDLFRYAGSTGEFSHGEPGRGGVGTNLGYHNTLLAAYGESAFAVRGGDIDPARARTACQRLAKTVGWLAEEQTRPACIGARCAPNNTCTPSTCVPGSTRTFEIGGTEVYYNDIKSLFHIRLAQCAERHRLSPSELPRGSIASHKAAALTAATAWTAYLAEHVQSEPRDIGRLIPWLEGVDEVIQALPSDTNSLITNMHSIVEVMRTSMGSLQRPGFEIIPMANERNVEAWTSTTAVPTYTRTHNGADPNDPQADPARKERRGYMLSHFATSAYDASVLKRYTNSPIAERIAAGSIGWALGLNPGLPESKVIRGTASGRPWSAGAFVSGLLPSPERQRARGYTSFLMWNNRRKPAWSFYGETYLGTGVPDNDGPFDRREAWLVNPNNPNFLSLVNGHVVITRNVDIGGVSTPMGSWDYWNQGEYGWESGETFMALDGAFLKAFLYYEDNASNVAPPPIPANVYPADTTRPQFFDTTPAERLETGWGFGNVDTVSFAHASRMAHNFCTQRGFVSGHPTGHQNSTNFNVGVFCFPPQSLVLDISTTTAGFPDINTVSWAQASRSAHAICTGLAYNHPTFGLRTYAGGVFTGHQIGSNVGLACLRQDSARFINSTWAEANASGWNFSDVNTIGWAHASRAATNMCSAKGYPLGGFLNGHQLASGTDVTKPLLCIANQSSSEPFPEQMAGLLSVSNIANSASLAVFPSTGTELAAAWTQWGTTGGWDSTRRFLAGDYNGDGRTDMLSVTNDLNQNTFAVSLSNGASFTTSTWLPQSGTWAATPIFLSGDFDGDGRSDVASVWNNGGNTSIAVWKSTGTGLAAPTQWITTWGWDSTSAWVTGDFNGDGRTDIATVWNDGGTNTFAMRLSTGSSFTVSTWLPNSGGWASTPKFYGGDFDGDGRGDIASVWNNGGNTSVAVWKSTGSGFGAPTQWVTTWGWDPGAKWVTGDFDADGKTDIATVWQNGLLGTIAMRRSTGSAFTVGTWLANAGIWSSSTQWFSGKFL
jgi:hypothetical protein